MGFSTLEIIIIVIALIAVFVLVRLFYQRTMRVRNRLQMEQMFTNITHELLTPLAILSASVEHLHQKEPQYDDEYSMMQLNIQRCVRLLQQILETSKSLSGDLRLLVSHGDIMRYIRETATTIKPLMQRNELDFNITCTPESMMGWIDPDKLDKIIFNLLSNAAKYTPKGGNVTLDVQTNKNYDRIIIRVIDTGKGIPKERQKTLFQRFNDGEYRSNHTFGTGLGMALTRDLVYLHGGTINYKSEEGKGTTFIVELPINKESFTTNQIDEHNKIIPYVPKSLVIDYRKRPEPTPILTPEELQANKEAEENAYKILIVEDNIELLMLMKQILFPKYHVLTASNGREALEVIRTFDLDLIVSDVMMPIMDGYELTKTVKNNPDFNHIPIILLTAKTQDKDKEEGLRIGADDYINKPFRLGDLTMRIDNIIEKRKRIQSDFRQLTIDETKKAASTPSPDNEFLQRAIECVNKHLDDTEFDRDAFAREMGASASTLYNKLRATTGMNVTNFIRDIRLKSVDGIIKANPDLRVSDLAYSIGFKDPKYFATIFKKEFGMQPKEYIEKLRNS